MAKAMPELRFIGEMYRESSYRYPSRLRYGVPEWYAALKRNGMRPSRAAAYTMIQVPYFMTFVWSIRRLVVTEECAKTGGMLWFPDLSIADPYTALPVIAVGLTYLNLNRGITPENKDWIINKIRGYF